METGCTRSGVINTVTDAGLGSLLGIGVLGAFLAYLLIPKGLVLGVLVSEDREQKTQRRLTVGNPGGNPR